MNREIIDKIKENIKSILNDSFKNPAKHTIIEYEDRLNFPCPYCGDSDDLRKRRGNIYLANLTFHCYNCGHHTDYLKFMHDFDMPIGIENLETLSNTVKSGQRKKHTTFDISLFNKIDEIALTREQLKKGFYLKEITSNSEIYQYLCGRCLNNKTNRFLYNKYHNELWVLNLNGCGKIIGAQIRSFDENKVKYRTYNISKIYKYLGMEFPYSDDENMLNQISITFNITNVELFEPLYIFEGAIDAMFLKNSVGICGVNRTFDLIEELPNAKYFFDNDKAGFLEATEKLKEGKYIFMWAKFLNDLSVDKNIKDLNELIVYMINSKIKFDFGRINDYFTNNELDLINV